MSSEKKPAALVPAEKLNQLAERCRDAVALAKGMIAETFTLALAVQELRGAIVPLVPQIRPLVGTSLGFRTDRDTGDKPAYPDAVIADCLVEATARGLRWTGNEMNIIGGRCYTTKEGYARLVSDLPGLSDLELTPAVPRMGDGGAVVKYRATWKQDGKPMLIERDIPTRLNAGMGADGAIGKATRKILAAVHARVTGSLQSFADADAEDVEPSSKAGVLAERMAGRTIRTLPPAPPQHEGIPGVDEDSLTGAGPGKR